jgi:hypothetical protein
MNKKRVYRKAKEVRGPRKRVWSRADFFPQLIFPLPALAGSGAREYNKKTWVGSET